MSPAGKTCDSVQNTKISNHRKSCNHDCTSPTIQKKIYAFFWGVSRRKIDASKQSSRNVSHFIKKIF
jgi:hypothetical protein